MDSIRPLCLLALDGGGVRGLSELLILEEVMQRLAYDLGIEGDLLPADFFDLIGGTSTGGLIALLLGRLRLSVPEAIHEYVRITKVLFSTPRKPFSKLRSHMFSGRVMEESVKQLLITRGIGNKDGEERMLANDLCKVFVCAVPQGDITDRSGPRLFRTYEISGVPSFNCKIWEACRATSAAPRYFEPIKIGFRGMEETFLDGALGYNNPVEQVVDEAGRVFHGHKIGCVVSIGTGTTDAVEYPSSPLTSPVALAYALKKMATDSDRVAEKMYGRLHRLGVPYFRFNVDRGMQCIRLEEWNELSRVNTFTKEYLQLHSVGAQVDALVNILLTRCQNIVPGRDFFHMPT